MNHVRQRTADELREVEHQGFKVVDNEDGLFAFETTQPGKRIRIAAFDAKTAKGTGVVALAFLDEQQIQELEARRRGKAAGLLGAGVAHADVQPVDHYHTFWRCSWVYQYANSWNIYVHMCGADSGSLKWMGQAVATAIGFRYGKPLLGFLSGLMMNYGLDQFTQPDGSVEIYVPGDTLANDSGYALHYPMVDWWWYFAQSDPNYGWAQRASNGSLWFIFIDGV